MNRFKQVMQVSALALAIMAANSATAEEQSLDRVIVLGTDEPGFDVALTSEMIEKRQAGDLEDLLRHEPSITVGGGAAVAQKIYVRGMEDTLLNVTIDGATQAGYLYHHQGRVYVEPELIKDIVVRPGAGNATDGAGALGGAIHFNLKDAKDMVRDGEQAGALVKSGFGSVNRGLKNHISAYGMLTDDFGALVSVTDYASTEDYKDGHGDDVAETEESRQNVSIKLSGNVAADHYVSFSYETYADEGRRYARSNMGEIGFHPAYLNIPVDQKTQRDALVLNHKYNPDNNLVDVSTTVYHTDSSIEKQGDVWRLLDENDARVDPTHTQFGTVFYGDVYDGQWHGGGVETLGFKVSNTSKIDSHELEYGLEVRNDEAGLINPILAFAGETTDIQALFIQGDVQLADSLSLSTGVRYDNYDYTDNSGVNISDSQFSPNATVLYKVNDALELSAGYAKAFKGVSLPEVFLLESGFNGAGDTLQSYTDTATIDIDGFDAGELKAEESDNIELGFQYQSGRLATSGEFFRQTIKNAQVINSGTWSRYSYVDDVQVDGYALRLAYNWDNLVLNSGVAHSKPEINGEPLGSGAMGLGTSYARTWTLGLEYDLKGNIVLGWDARLVETLTDVQDGQDEKDGYEVHDIYVQWLPTQDLTVGLAVNNVLDTFYYDQGTFYTNAEDAEPFGLPEPGRDFRLYASYQF